MPADPLRSAVILLCAIAATFTVFAAWPGLDLVVSGWFHDPASGFAAVDTGLPNLLRLAIWRMSEIALLASLLAVLVGLWTRAPVAGVPRRLWAYVMALYLLAPGLLVDVILKPVWGRARPADVTEFGGTLMFTPPHEIAHQCMRNCSFVAGEMAGAVTLALVIALILRELRPRLPGKTYRWGLVIAALLPLYAGFQRIAAGRHFLSDVVLSALFVVLLAVALHAVMFRRERL